MYVCLCKGISARTLRRHAAEGVRCVEEIGKRCGAGTVCGTCRTDIAGILRDAESQPGPGREAALAAK